MGVRDEDLDLLKALRILAFRSVEKPDHEYILRHVCRWYSKAFHTPLEAVDEIPLERVLTHYFEDQIEQMTDEDREELRERLCETRPERLAREIEEAAKAVDDAAFEAMVREEAKAQNAERAKEGPAKADDAPIVPLPIMGQTAPAFFNERDEKPIRPLPPDIKMTFISESELESLEEWDLLGPPKKDKP